MVGIEPVNELELFIYMWNLNFGHVDELVPLNYHIKPKIMPLPIFLSPWEKQATTNYRCSLSKFS